MAKCAVIECRSEAYHHISGGVDKYCVLHHLTWWKQRKTMVQLLKETKCKTHKLYYESIIPQLEELMFA